MADVGLEPGCESSRLQAFLKSGQQSGNLMYCTLREAQIFCDAFLVSSDGHGFGVHRAFLAQKSMVMMRLFSERNNNENQVYKIDSTAAVLEIVLKCAYGKAEVLSLLGAQEAFDVLNVAQQYGFKVIEKSCCKVLQNRITLQNCLHTMGTATALGKRELKEAAETFVLRNFDQLYTNSPEFLELPFKEFEALLMNKKLFVPEEAMLLDAMAHWMLHDPLRARYSSNLLSLVKFWWHKQTTRGERHRVKEIVLKYPRLWQWTDWAAAACEGPPGFIPSPNTFPDGTRVPRTVIVAIGGWGDGAPTNTAEVFDYLNNSWKVDKRFALEERRAYHACLVKDKKVYVYGGFDGSNFLSSLHVLDLDDIEAGWVEKTGMHHQRCYIAGCIFQDQLYAIGGLDGLVRIATVERFNEELNQWEMMPDLCKARSDASACDHKGNLYVAGGFDGHMVLHSVEVFNPDTKTWKLIQPYMSSARSGLSIVSYSGRLFVLGGFDGTSRTSRSEWLDETTSQWIQAPKLTFERSNFSTKVIEGKLFVFGGYNGLRTVETVEYFEEEDPKESSDEDEFYQGLYKNHLLCDGTIVSSDGHSFPVHRAFVHHKSPFLGTLFFNPLGAKELDQVKLKALDSKDLMECLTMVYSLPTLGNLENCLRLADKFLIKQVRVKCAKMLESQLSAMNCIQTFTLARKHLHEFYKISNEWKQFSASDLANLLSSKWLYLPEEVQILDIIANYVLSQPKAKQIDCGKCLLTAVRFGLICLNFSGNPERVDALKSLYPSLKLWTTWRHLLMEELSGFSNEYSSLRPGYLPRMPRKVLANRYGVLTIGGWSGDRSTNATEAYDCGTDNWFQRPSYQLPHTLAYHGVASLGTRVYIFGGFDGTNYYNSAYMLDVTKCQWKEVACMSKLRYSEQHNQWSAIAKMHRHRSDATACAHQGKIFVAGGFDGESSTDSVEFYDPQKNIWTVVSAMTLPSRVSGLCLTVWQGALCTLGGFDSDTRLQSVYRWNEDALRWEWEAMMLYPRQVLSTQ
ncbi:unnamed protein product [Notodromas monacha]|uniref:BTB domain-containing protein n=1 Tax=Notodromas monacha TaxID=399045 RepID=A0A7R9BHC3_9CRUS|nr:unnamed protein product [Notodromas monacha]CAG0915495.1 unnamed protein product [Notodromas monacha]